MEFLTHATALAALAVVAVQQILKLKVVPVSFANKYPVLTNIALSVLAAAYVVWQNGVIRPFVWTQWTQCVLLVATISVVAALTYNMTLRNSPTIKSMEGTK